MLIQCGLRGLQIGPPSIVPRRTQHCCETFRLVSVGGWLPSNLSEGGGYKFPYDFLVSFVPPPPAIHGLLGSYRALEKNPEICTICRGLVWGGRTIETLTHDFSFVVSDWSKCFFPRSLQLLFGHQVLMVGHFLTLFCS